MEKWKYITSDLALIDTLSRPDTRTIPVIALMANDFDKDVQHNMQSGLNEHLSRPV